MKTPGDIAASSLSILLGGEQVMLMAEHALHWPAGRTLFVADLHLGKAETFRRARVPLPRGTTARDLARLAAAVRRSEAERLIVLGDFFHAAPGRDADAWLHWREAHPDLEVFLVRGNHDRHAGDPPAEWRIASVEEPHRLGPFVLRHFPDGPRRNRHDAEAGGHVLAGHVHPAVRLRGGGGDRLRLPCFHASPGVTVLPAFTSFGGSHAVRPMPGDRVFGIADGAVIDVTRVALGR